MGPGTQEKNRRSKWMFRRGRIGGSIVLLPPYHRTPLVPPYHTEGSPIPTNHYQKAGPMSRDEEKEGFSASNQEPRDVQEGPFSAHGSSSASVVQPDHDTKIRSLKESTRKNSELIKPQGSQAQSQDLRKQLGQVSVGVSDWVNDNLAIVRIATMTSIGLLTAFGISQTPLFFRYRTVADIPSNVVRTRRKIRCRLMQAATSTEADQPIRCQVRHLSPLESILPKNMFDALLKLHPSVAVGIRPHTNKRELLNIEIAGVRSAGFYMSTVDQPGEWINRLAREQTAVTVQLLGRRIIESDPRHDMEKENRVLSPIKPRKRKIPGLETALDSSHLAGYATDNENVEQIAVARLYYRPKPTNFFPIDVGYHMVRSGRASISSNGLYGSAHDTKQQRILDTTESIKDIQADADYMERLARAEFEAATESRGMWADASIRERRKDITDEVEFQSNASLWQKLWRKLRGG